MGTRGTKERVRQKQIAAKQGTRVRAALVELVDRRGGVAGREQVRAEEPMRILDAIRRLVQLRRQTQIQSRGVKTDREIALC